MKKITSKIVWMLMGILLTTCTTYAGRFALVADYSGPRVAEFYVNGTTWTYVTNFVNTSTPMGSLGPIIHPTCVAQDQQGRIYVSDQGAAGANRILRFNTNGVFIDMVGTNGLNGFSVPGSGIDDMVSGPDGNIYGTLAFGTANNQILKFNVATTNWSVLYSNSTTLSTPRGLDFGPDGNLYVNSRGNARMLVISTSGVLLRTNATYSGSASTTPMGLRYAPSLSKFICTSGNGNSLICSCPTNGTSATNGTLITVANPTGGPGASKTALGVLADGTNVFYAPFAPAARVYLCNNTTTATVTAVDTGTTPALNSVSFMNFVSGFSIGTLQSVALNVTRTTMIQGTSESAQLLGNYTYQNGVNLTTDPGTSLSSSAPSVVTIAAGGLVSAVGVGSATLTASNSGLTNTVVITIVPLTTTLIHRYSFTNDASDSVGGANGTANGSSYSFANGQINFMPTSQFDIDYVNFGPNVISSNDAITFEAWASFGVNYPQARLFDFGNNGGGNNGLSYVYLTPHSASGSTRVAIKTPTGGETDLDVPGLDNQTNVHIVVVFHPLAGYIKLYLNGALAAQNLNVTGQDLANVTDDNSYLGQSQFFLDPAAYESVDEFRIYSGVLNATNVAFDYAAGPNNLPGDPGALQSISLTVNTNLMLQQGQQTIAVYGNFANVTNVPLNNFPGISFSSDNPGVLTVSSSGMVKSVGFGTATVTTMYGNQTMTYTFTVNPLPQTSLLVAASGNNQVLKYNAVGTNWTANGIFVSAASGAFALGTNGNTSPLTSPFGLAQDAAGNIFVGEGVNGGRVLKFSANGTYLATVGTEGTDFTGIPDALALGTDGDLYMSTAFGTNATSHILKYSFSSNAWSEFVAQNVPPVAFTSPRGIAFDPAGNLYVCNRGGFGAANRMVQEFDTNGLYVQDLAIGITSPQALTYDSLNNRFITSVGNTSLDSIATNGVVTPIATGVGALILDALNVGPNVFYSDWGAAGVYVVTSSSSGALVAGGMVNAGHIVQTALPPNLRITAAGGNIIVSWPYSVAAFNLEFSGSLNPVNWQNVLPAPVLVGNTMQVTLPASGDTMFFRLRH